ncbi:MAG: DNA cytosine methyltransferase [Pseudomonas sp.]|nr:DNA cytosine methyltransferase [Pseudomonas sp.]
MSTLNTQYQLNYADKIRVDLFAGGGGASTGTEMATGMPVDIAVNHSDDAVSMHRVNHPHTRHFTCDVYEVKPRAVTMGRQVAHLHASPDCTHHSQAAGGQPRSTASRSLSWVICMWAGQAMPDMITMENVRQIRNWGPLIAKRCKATGRVITLEKITCPTTGKPINRVAAPGERVPREQQFLIPCPKRRGQTWRAFLQHLRRLGYQVEHNMLRACDFGAATTRERLFLVARRDGQPIQWPEPTHFEKPKRGQKKWQAAADHIDWTLPCPSIFERPRPLADATLRRIAKGIKKFVLDANEPFIVPIANWSSDTLHPVSEPLRTITGNPKGGSFAVATPTLVQTGFGEAPGQSPRSLDIHKPLGTIMAGGVKHAVASAVLMGVGGRAAQTESRSVTEPAFTTTSKADAALIAPTLVKFRGQHTGQRIDEPLPVITSGGNCKRPAGAAHAMGTACAYLAQMNGGFNETPGHALTGPASTITNTGSQQQLVSANLVTLRRNCTGQPVSNPAPTMTAGAEHHALVQCTLSPEVIEEKALRVAAFLMSYYGTDNTSAPGAALPTITTRDRLALVTVVIQGNPYVIIDIGLRMLQPIELYACQGFPSNYIIDRGHDGRRFTKSAQVKMVGNSVSPQPMAAILKANPSAPLEQLAGVAA